VPHCVSKYRPLSLLEEPGRALRSQCLPIPGCGCFHKHIHRSSSTLPNKQRRDEFPGPTSRQPDTPPASQRSVSSPHRVDQVCDRINENATDSEQDHPYQIIDLLFEFGESPRRLWRSPRKDGTQHENYRHGCRNNDDELIHKLATIAVNLNRRRQK
jgi:hypothetical protein